MVVEFLSQEHVPVGFEILISNKEICPESKGGIWNLWWNVQLSDDPAAWDDEVKAINDLQSELVLKREHRLIRAHIAELCRVSPLFPESVNILCEEIGSGSLSKPYVLGCEGRNLLNTISDHEYRQTLAQRGMVRGSYSRALKRYLSGDDPVTPVDAKVKGLLGKVTGGKEEPVERLLAILESDSQLRSSLHEMSKEVYKETPELLEKKVRPFNCLTCPMVKPTETGLTSCVCCEGLTIDVCLLGIGGYDDWSTMFKVYNRFYEEYILVYVSVINTWLEGTPPPDIISKIPFRYLTEEISENIIEKVTKLLGTKDVVKVWLTACLLKTLRSNQRWHDTHELIDDYPETVSWLNNRLLKR